VKAEKAISEAKKNGGWVLLQNCHLYPTWMPQLDHLFDEIQLRQTDKSIHHAFRLFLTSYSCP